MKGEWRNKERKDDKERKRIMKESEREMWEKEKKEKQERNGIRERREEI